jgi:DNA-binding response OmpR family regulator
VTRVLLVDDEANLRHALTYALRQEGYDVAAAADGEEGIRLFHQAPPDAVILDVMLPGIDGYEVCRRIRRESDVPVIMLTARDQEIDRIVALEIGADDHIGKPFSTRELVARIRALLRRAARPAVGPTETVLVLVASGLRVDPARRRVEREGAEVPLKPREFDLLVHLMANRGVVLSRDRIMSAVWGEQGTDSRTVDTHVKRLRVALGDAAAAPRWIETVRGVGYRFREA